MLTAEQWKLVQDHLPLIQSTAYRLVEKPQLRQDLYDIGLDSLIYSAAKYRKDAGKASFKNYAISGLRLRLMNRLTRMIHEKRKMMQAVAQWKRLKLEAIEQRKRDDTQFLITDALKKLPIEERRALLRKHGLPVPGEWRKRPAQPKKGPKHKYTPVRWSTHALERWEERFSLGTNARELKAAYNRAEYVGEALDGCKRLVDRGSRAEFRVRQDRGIDGVWEVLTIVWYSGQFDSIKGDSNGDGSIVAYGSGAVA